MRAVCDLYLSCQKNYLYELLSIKFIVYTFPSNMAITIDMAEHNKFTEYFFSVKEIAICTKPQEHFSDEKNLTSCGHTLWVQLPSSLFTDTRKSLTQTQVHNLEFIKKTQKMYIGCILYSCYKRSPVMCDWMSNAPGGPTSCRF